MAMPSANIILPDKMPLPSGGGRVVGGDASGEVRLRQWVPDERDGFISWLRAEFAAANAIIDSLCHHLSAVGERGEYDAVVGCIQQRRCNWNPILHMQQYFSVAEVVYALQRVSPRRQQRYFDPVKTSTKDLRSFPMGSKQTQWAEHTKEVHAANSEAKSEGEFHKFGDKSSALMEEKNDTVVKDQIDDKLNGEEVVSGSANTKPPVEGAGDQRSSSLEENNLESLQDNNEKQSAPIVPKTFVAPEIFDGKTINVVDGLKLYEELFDDAMVSKLVSSVHDMRSAGKKGQLPGQTYVVSKKPSKGHGRETIQLGRIVADAPAYYERASGMSKDRKIEAIPSSIQDVIGRLVNMQVTNVKPDCCVIDFYNEGDHSQPHVLPPWYGRPACILFLTECQMSFGRVIRIDRPGDFRGSLKLSLSSGSLLVMEGNSTDFAKHAIYSSRKQRILITLTKSLPKKVDTPLPSSSSSTTTTPNWSPSPSWSPNNIRHCMGQKRYPAIPAPPILAPVPPIHPHIATPNGLSPLFVIPPLAMPYPSAVPTSLAWPGPPPPRHPSPSLPFTGTGVFLPPSGSGTSSSPQPTLSSANEMNLTGAGQGKSNDNGSTSIKEQPNVKPQTENCNGSIETMLINGALAIEESKAENV